MVTISSASTWRGLILLYIMLSAVYCYPRNDLNRKDQEGLQLLQSQSTRTRLANELLESMMLLAENMYRSMGANEVEMSELKRKRSAITACYFQAISCY